MNLFKRFADNTKYKSVSNKFRRKRFNCFLEFINDLPRPVSVLDVGGTVNFWIQMNFLNSMFYSMNSLMWLGGQPFISMYPLI